MVDPETVRRRLRRLDELLQRLDELADLSLEAFRDDPIAQAAAERLLHLAIQVTLDVGAHVLSDRGVVDWEAYREIPDRLVGEGVIPRNLADRLARAAGQRNILVHLYLDVDPAQVHETLTEGLDAFVAFAGHMERLVAEEEEGGPGER